MSRSLARSAFGLLAVAAPIGCPPSASPEIARSDPSTTLPTPSKASPPRPPLSSGSASSLPHAKPDAQGSQVCEPVVRCGFWSGCVWLERIAGPRYRALSGDEKGGIFVRRHACSPADAGSAGCAVYCSGPGPECVDGLHPELEACSESAPPRPISIKCQMYAGICGSLM